MFLRCCSTLEPLFATKHQTTCSKLGSTTHTSVCCVLLAFTLDIDIKLYAIVQYSVYFSCALRETPIKVSLSISFAAKQIQSSGHLLHHLPGGLAQPSKSRGVQLSVPGHNSNAMLQSLAALTFLIYAFRKTEPSCTQSMPTEKQDESYKICIKILPITS